MSRPCAVERTVVSLAEPPGSPQKDRSDPGGLGTGPNPHSGAPRRRRRRAPPRRRAPAGARDGAGRLPRPRGGGGKDGVGAGGEREKTGPGGRRRASELSWGHSIDRWEAALLDVAQSRATAEADPQEQ